MKKFLSIMLTALLLAGSGCQKYDDSTVWDELYSQSERIAALEEWQSTVNSNIEALHGLITAVQNQRYITDVSPLTTNPGGWVITFNTGTPNPITIQNGAKGDKGEQGATGANGNDGATPQIGVREEPAGSGVYYWTLNGAWLLNGSGQKIPATGDKGDNGAPGTPGDDGTNGVTPKLRINASTNYWQVCLTGTCDVQNNEGWNDVLDSNGNPVKATGADGTPGTQGGAIFAENGVDNSHTDYVEFILADNTIIQVPRYAPLGITFTQPEKFPKGGVTEVGFTTQGNATAVKVLDVPTDWTVTVALSGNAGTFTVTAPAVCTSFNEAFIFVADVNGNTVMRAFGLIVEQYTPDNTTVDFTDFCPAPTGTAWTLRDSRAGGNNETYKVRKMPDGHYWMIQDLKFGTCPNSTASWYNNNSATATTHAPTMYTGYVGHCRATSQANAGYLYSWPAVMQDINAYAGSGISNFACAAGTPGNACQGICPAGWHIPTGDAARNDSEYAMLNTAMQNEYGCTADDCWNSGSLWEGVSGGICNASGSPSAQGSSAYYWSSTYNAATNAQNLNFGSGYAYAGTGNHSKSYGAAVRCVKNY